MGERSAAVIIVALKQFWLSAAGVAYVCMGIDFE